MNFYEIAEDGYHSPLTVTQIRELFRAGLLKRHSPCRALGKPQWRTLDELFPLLKYDSSAQWASLSDNETKVPFGRREIVIAAAATLLVLVGIGLYFSSSPRWVEMPRPTIRSQVAAAKHQYSVAPFVAQSPSMSNATSSQVNSFVAPSYSVPSQPVTQPQAKVGEDQSARFEQERQRREQLQREQAANAERLRAEAAEKERQRKEAAGRDEHVELDKVTMIDIGGSWTSVKIHDNNTASFDAWINGVHYPDREKQKGITGSRTDETPIYGTGGATLYYVWEISGKLNHCLLRVRKG